MTDMETTPSKNSISCMRLVMQQARVIENGQTQPSAEMVQIRNPAGEHVGSPGD